MLYLYPLQLAWALRGQCLGLGSGRGILRRPSLPLTNADPYNQSVLSVSTYNALSNSPIPPIQTFCSVSKDGRGFSNRSDVVQPSAATCWYRYLAGSNQRLSFSASSHQAAAKPASASPLALQADEYTRSRPHTRYLIQRKPPITTAWEYYPTTPIPAASRSSEETN